MSRDRRRGAVGAARGPGGASLCRPGEVHLITATSAKRPREVRDLGYVVLVADESMRRIKTQDRNEGFSLIRPALDPSHTLGDDPLSSSAMRFALFPKASTDSLDPSAIRPFGLRRVKSYPPPGSRNSSYCHLRQIAVDGSGNPLVSRSTGDDDADPKPKEWGSKTYSDGDEGQEESNWGWEEA